MGNLCGSSLTEEERRQLKQQKLLNQGIEDKQMDSRVKDEAVKKLLLLGAGESGKSTLFKQMITLYGKGYPEEERMTYKPIVHQNTITAMHILLQFCEQLSSEINSKIEEKNEDIATRFADLNIDTLMTQSVANDITALWTDSGIQITYENRVKFQFPDSGSYFFERVDSFCKEDYIPTEQDVLRCRVRTTGIVETSFEIDGNQFKMFDVGGQRNERKKWIHCFENVTCVIFVAAISEYDQTLFEDETTNRVVEALNLFDEICNSKWFTKTSVILFLNKRDLFMEKVAKVPLTVCFDEYNGPVNDYDAGCEFFREKFEARNRQTDKEIYTHVTCATDTNNISHVFNAVKDILLKQSLREGGLI
eukprot:976075_1